MKREILKLAWELFKLIGLTAGIAALLVLLVKGVM